MTNNNIDKNVLTGWASKHKLDVHVRSGAIVPSDDSRVPYHSAQGAVQKEGEVR